MISKGRPLTVFSLFDGPVLSKRNEQKLYLYPNNSRSLIRISWLLIEYANALLRYNNAIADESASAVEERQEEIRRLRQGQNRNSPTLRAMDAVLYGDIDFITFLRSRGGSSKIMDDMIGAQKSVEAHGGSTLTVAKEQAKSAAGAMFIFGKERWAQENTGFLFHGRGIGQPPPQDINETLRNNARRDVLETIRPRLLAVAHDEGRVMMDSLIDRAAQDPANLRIDVSMNADILRDAGVLTRIFKIDIETSEAIQERTGVCDVLRNSSTNHPIRQYLKFPHYRLQQCLDEAEF